MPFSFTNVAPLEVIAAPFDVHYAPLDTAEPSIVTDLDEDVWIPIGTNKSLNYDRDTAVTVEPKQTVVPWRSAGDAGSRKFFRQDEDLSVKLKLIDLALEQLAHAFNSNTVTQEVGSRKIGLSRGFGVAVYALVIRGMATPYLGTGKMQFWIPRAAQIGSPSILLGKPATPSGVDLEWMAQVWPDATSEDERFGILRAEDGST